MAFFLNEVLIPLVEIPIFLLVLQFEILRPQVKYHISPVIQKPKYISIGDKKGKKHKQIYKDRHAQWQYREREQFG